MAYMVSNNLGIDSATQGISKTGIENYRQDLQLHVINESKEKLRNYQNIVTVIGQNWNGTAANKFVNNLDKSVNQACDALDEIQKAIDALIGAVKDSMINQDENMIEDGESPFGA